MCLQAYRHRPFGSLDNELGHHAEDDDHDGCDDHDYIDDSETDSSDSIWEPRSSVRVVFSISFVLIRDTEETEVFTQKDPTHLPSGSLCTRAKVTYGPL